MRVHVGMSPLPTGYETPTTIAGQRKRHPRRCPVCKHFGKSPELLGAEQIREYQLHPTKKKAASPSSCMQTVCRLRFLYTQTLHLPIGVEHIPLPRYSSMNSGSRNQRLRVLRSIPVARAPSAWFFSARRAAMAASLLRPNFGPCPFHWGHLGPWGCGRRRSFALVDLFQNCLAFQTFRSVKRETVELIAEVLENARKSGKKESSSRLLHAGQRSRNPKS